MKLQLPVIMFVLLLVIGVGAGYMYSQVHAVRARAEHFGSLPIATFGEKLDSGEYVVIDVRTPEEYAQGKVPDSINVDFYADDFREQLDKLNKKNKYLIYCNSGNRTGQTMDIMMDLGFSEVYELAGGIESLQ